MSGDVHVRICEGVRGWFPCATRLIVGIMGSKADATEIKDKISEFLHNTLKLKLSSEKTKITHLKKGVLFLGYQIQQCKSIRIIRVKRAGTIVPQRTTSKQMRITIPHERIRRFALHHGYGDIDQGQGKSRNYLINNSDLEILMTYNTELRGFANYYTIADNYACLSLLFHVARMSFLCTLSGKYKSSVRKIAKRLSKGSKRITVCSEKGKRYPLLLLSDLPRTKSRAKVADRRNCDLLPNTFKYSATSEFERRLLANKCEACGDGKGPFEVHHVRRLKDLSKKKHITYLDKIMIERQRKTLVLCLKCHCEHHHKQSRI